MKEKHFWKINKSTRHYIPSFWAQERTIWTILGEQARTCVLVYRTLICLNSDLYACTIVDPLQYFFSNHIEKLKFYFLTLRQ